MILFLSHCGGAESAAGKESCEQDPISYGIHLATIRKVVQFLQPLFNT